jgi:hypothetical protein
MTIRGFIQNGQVILPGPVALPDGTEVRIVPVNASAGEDEDRPLHPHEIAHILAMMDQVQPFEMTEDERAAWETDRQMRKNWEKARFHEHADRLRDMWQ